MATAAITRVCTRNRILHQSSDVSVLYLPLRSAASDSSRPPSLPRYGSIGGRSLRPDCGTSDRASKPQRRSLEHRRIRPHELCVVCEWSYGRTPRKSRGGSAGPFYPPAATPHRPSDYSGVRHSGSCHISNLVRPLLLVAGHPCRVQPEAADRDAACHPDDLRRLIHGDWG